MSCLNISHDIYEVWNEYLTHHLDTDNVIICKPPDTSKSTNNDLCPTGFVTFDSNCIESSE